MTREQHNEFKAMFEAVARKLGIDLNRKDLQRSELQLIGLRLCKELLEGNIK